MKSRRETPSPERITRQDRGAKPAPVSPFDTTRSEAASSARGPDLPPPPRIGAYRILEPLGRGGMGEVFLAHDGRLDRKVALKRVRTVHLGDDELARRFEMEARVTALLQHPAIIPIYHFAKRRSPASGSEMFYTMRPVEGRTLGELIELLREDDDTTRDDWPTARIVRLFLQATNAVSYAHSRGVVHRDLKPSNIMIGPFEEVLVLDWGVATILDRLEDDNDSTKPVKNVDTGSFRRLRPLTSAQALIGTPAYMAPEQLESGRASPSTDVFSLGVILFELLTLRLPWSAQTVEELIEAMRTPPPDPSLMSGARHVPPALSRAIFGALEFDETQRFSDVGSFSEAVANALEGRGRWHLVPDSRDRARWRLARGRRRSRDEGTIELRARGERESLRYFCTIPFGDNVRLEMRARTKGRVGLSLWLNTQLDSQHTIVDGYGMAALSGRRRRLSLRRSGRIVAGARKPELQRGVWHRIRAERDGDHLRLSLDGKEIYSYSDPIPLTGGYVGMTAEGPGIEIRDLRVSTRGTDASVSCLAVPDAFFNRGFFDEARHAYDHIVLSQPGRNEGQIAQFRSALCSIELAKREAEREVAELHLEEAGQRLRVHSGHADCCLIALGRALIARERDDPKALHAALRAALEHYQDDPHYETAREWAIGQLHALEHDERRTLAALLPVVIRYGRVDWGRDLVDGVVRKLRAQWEIPPFMIGRGRYRSGDQISRLESEIYFAFWSGQTEWIESVTHQILDDDDTRQKPHIAVDAIWCLLEHDTIDGARAVAEHAERVARSARDRRALQQVLYARSALLALDGDLTAGSELLREADGNPSDRAFNSARLWLARAAWKHQAGALSHLPRMGTRDTFAREHRAWYALLEGDAELARRELEPLVDRGDHTAGRNMVNFLHGATLLERGDVPAARLVFGHLDVVPWPRTWTLGSHLARGTLGLGNPDAYLAAAFDFESRALQRHREVLAAVDWTPPAVPSAITADSAADGTTYAF